MAAPSQFPAYLSVEYQGDGGGFPAFERQADTAFSHVEGRARQFSSNMENVQQVVTKALSMPRNAGGSLDLNVPELQRAAAAAEARATAAREVAVATRLAAEAEGDYSQQARLSIAAAEAVANEHQQAAAAARSYANAQEQVQNQLNRTASQTQAVVQSLNRGTTAMGAMTNSVRASRFATLQAGQQFQDFFIQIQGGTNPLTAFSQQASQLAFVMSGAGGSAGKFAAFMSGPWGTAIFAGISVLSLLIATLRKSESATDDAEKAAKAFGDRQADIKRFIDDATGAIVEQNKVLVQNAILLRQAKIDAKRDEIDKNRQDISDLLTRRATVSTTFRAERQSGFREFDPAVIAVIGKANGDVTKLVDGIRELSKTRPDLRGLADDLTKIAGPVIDAERQISDLRTEIEQLQGKSSKGFNDPSAVRGLIEIAAATDNYSKRIAELKEQQRELDAAVRRGEFKGEGGRERYVRESAAIERQIEAQKKLQAETRKSGRASDTAANAAARLAERGEDAAKKISNITDRFSDIPPAQQAVNRAMRELDDLADDFQRKQPPNYGEIVRQLEQARQIVTEGLTRPFDDLTESYNEQLTIGDLLIRGREVEANSLRDILALQRQMGPLTLDQIEAIVAMNEALERQTQEMEKVRAAQQAYLDASRSLQQVFRNSIADVRTEGFGALKGLVSGVTSTFNNLLADVISENLFGDLFREIDREIRAATGIKTAAEIVIETLKKFGIKVEEVGNALAAIANKAAGGTVVAANDNSAASAMGNLIEVVGNRQRFANPVDFMSTAFERVFSKFLPRDLADKIGKAVGTAIEGAAYGQTASSLILGGGGSRTGSAIGGALGNAVGKALGKTVGGALGSALGPLGSIAGGLLGGLAGGLFSKTKKGSATIGADAFGELSVLGVKGNSGSRKRAAEDSAEAVIGSLEGIAEQFGAVIDASAGSVSVGVRKKSYRVDPTGQGATKTKNGAIDFGQDAQAAAEYAMLDLIKDGVLVGLRKGTQVLLQNASDLQVGLQKALKFENVFRDLKRAKDPVGAAIDDLNREFQSLINIFKQAGATTEEMGQLEELYGIRRKEAVEQAFDSVASALKDLMNEITIGDSGYSLRTRLANAQAAFNPLAARVQAGDSTAYDAFADASRQLMEISREFYGSGTEYFALLDQVKSITQGQLDYQQRLYDSATGGSALSFDIQPVVSATDSAAAAIVAEMQRQGLIANDNIGRQTVLLQQIASSLAAAGNPTGIASRFNF